MAGVAGCPAEAVPAAGRRALDLSGNPAARGRCQPVCAADRDHGRGFPVFRAPPGRGYRHRRDRRDRADAPRFRPGGRGRGGACPKPRSRCRGAGARRRPRHPRCRGIPRHLPRRAQGGGGRAHRHLRHHAERAQDQLRLYPPRQADRFGRGLRGRGVRGKAGPRDRGALCRRRLSVEFGQFPVSRRRAAGRACALRAGHGDRGGSSGRRRKQRSRFRAAGGRARSAARRRSRSTTR